MRRPAAERIFERMQRTKAGWGWEEFDRLYRGFGFRSREGARHTFYWHPDYPQLTATVARHRRLAVGYAQHAVTLIVTLKELEAEEEEDGTE